MLHVWNSTPNLVPSCQNLIWSAHPILGNTWALSTDGLKMQRRHFSKMCFKHWANKRGQSRAGKLRKLDKEGKAFCKSARLLQLPWLSSVLIGQWRSTHLPHIWSKCICPCKVYFSDLSDVFVQIVKCQLSFDWAVDECTPSSHLISSKSQNVFVLVK